MDNVLIKPADKKTRRPRNGRPNLSKRDIENMLEAASGCTEDQRAEILQHCAADNGEVSDRNWTGSIGSVSLPMSVKEAELIQNTAAKVEAHPSQSNDGTTFVAIPGPMLFWTAVMEMLVSCNNTCACARPNLYTSESAIRELFDKTTRHIVDAKKPPKSKPNGGGRAPSSSQIVGKAGTKPTQRKRPALGSLKKLAEAFGGGELFIDSGDDDSLDWLEEEDAGSDDETNWT